MLLSKVKLLLMAEINLLLMMATRFSVFLSVAQGVFKLQ